MYGTLQDTEREQEGTGQGFLSRSGHLMDDFEMLARVSYAETWMEHLSLRVNSSSKTDRQFCCLVANK